MAERSAEPHDDVEILEEPSRSPDPVSAEAYWGQVEAKLQTGARWFYWIAGLSVVNSLISLAEGDRQFIVGMGLTQVVDAIAVGIAQQSPDMALVAKIVAGVFTFFAAAVFVGLGFGSGKRHSWVFVVGMVFYALDGLIYLLAMEWLSLAFHVFVLTRLFTGFRACRELNAAESEMAVQEA